MTQASNSGEINPPEPIIPGFVSTDLSQYDSAQNRYCFQIAENSAPGTVIGRIRFDGGVTGQAFYTLIGPDTDKVALQPDGTLTLRAGAALDFEAGEEARTLHIEITAIFFGSDGSVAYAETDGTSVTITDVNEAPELTIGGSQSADIPEGTSVAGETGFSVTSTDPDAGDSVSYSLSDSRFEIVDGKLRVKADQNFDFETEPTVEVTVTATDQGGLTDQKTVSIRIGDVNERPFLALRGTQTLVLREGTSTGAENLGIGVIAADPDGDDLTFTVSDDRFDVQDGQLVVRQDQTFDFETEPSITLTVTALDPGGLEFAQTVSIAITNVNERPAMSFTGDQTLMLNEGRSVAAELGIGVITIDPDAEDSVTYTLSDDRFEIVDGRLMVKDGQTFDFESEPFIDLTVTATDSGGLTSSATTRIEIKDVNEAPTVNVDGTQTLNLREGTSAAGDTGFTVTAADPDSGDRVTFSVDDKRFEVTDGRLRVKDGKSFDFESEPTIEVTITGTDTGGLTHTGSVTITVTDVPEAPVVSLSGLQTLTLREGSSSAAADTGIAVSAADGDGDDLTFTTSDDRFEVADGVLRVKADQQFDFESEPQIEVTITGTDPGGLSHSQTTTITVTDVNEPPYLVDGNGDVLPAPTVDVAENQPGAVVLDLNARDPEGDAPIRFFLRSNHQTFTIDNNVLKLRDDVALDFEASDGPQTADIVLLTNSGGRPSFETVRITVNVTDVNEMPELTIAGSQTLDLAEGFSEAADTGFMVSTTDPDAADSVTFSVNDDRFEVVNGALRVKADQSFDFETEPAVEVTITATDRGGLTDTQTVSITITDVEPEGNQAPAMLVSGSQTLVLNEGISDAGDMGFTVSATDPNRDDVTFSVDDDRFEMVSGALRVKANQSFDFESEPSIEVTITASDPGGLTDSQTVTVTVTDVNEAPTVSISGSQTLTLNEGTSVAGDTGFTVSATDPDNGDSVSFSVDDNRFEVVNGALQVKADQSFDFEREPSVDLVITGTDQGSLTHSQSVTIAISNVNEAPTVSASGSQTLQINEGSSVAGDTGLTFGATDPDAGDIVTLTVDDDRFELVNGALRVKADQSFDFESEPTADLVITGTDQGGLTDSQAVTVAITNVNEAPTISVNGSQTLQLSEGTSVSGDTGFTVSAADPDQGESVEFSVDDTRFEIINGALRVKADQSFDFESEPSVDLVITGTDQGGLTHAQSVTIAITNVNEAPTISVGGSQTLRIYEGSSVAGDTGFTFSGIDPDAGDSVSFSVDDDRFAITDGKLQVKADQSFDFESEPTVDVTITGTDEGGLTDTQSVTIAVTDVDEPPEMTVRGSQILNIFEGLSPSGNTGFRVSARDPEGRHGTIFSVDDDRFEITNGQLRLKTGQKFDARVEPRVEVTITSAENGGEQLQTSQTVTLRVRDIAGVVFVGTKERTDVSITSSDLGSDKIAFDPTVTEVWHSMSGSDLVLEGFSQQAGRVVQTLTVTGMTQPFSRALLHNSGLPTLNKVTGGNPAGQETITGDSRANAIVGDAGENFLVGLAGYDRLFGGPDTDWADYSSSTAGVRVDLATGRGSRGHASGDRYTNVENVRGSRFNDVLTGDANANTLEGGAGDDTLDGRGGGDILRGGNGDDTVTYAMSNARVEVSIDDNGDSDYARGGHATGDQLYNIENLIGSRYADRLTGNAEANLFVGGAGGDTIDGRGGPDTISYYNSAYAVTVGLGATGGRQTGGDRRSDAYGDTLKNIENIEGSRYDDTLTGDDGRNVISGGRGADTIDGGDGVDTAAYTGSSSGVTAVLNEDGKSSKVGSRGDASGDILKNIEHLIGSRHNDILTGNSESNRFVGNGGSNFYRDGGTLYRAGGDTYDGGDGVDTVSYYGAAHGVTVNLGTGNGTGGRALGDRFVRKQGIDGVVRSTIENIVGTAHDDNLTGDAGANLFNAAEGADTVNGGGQDDGDVISYTDSEEWVRVDLALANAPQTGGGQTTRNGRTIINDARGDRLSNIENILGSDFNDQLYGNSGRNVFIDTEGADYMDGREGRDAEGREYVDTVSYARSGAAVTVDLDPDGHANTNDGRATGGSADEGYKAGIGGRLDTPASDLDRDGTLEHDQLINIEHVFGSRFSDTLKGDSGNNLFLGGRGGDNIDGRGGVDIVSYISSGSGVVIDLSAAAGSRARGGDATGDRLTNIESIEGSNDDDTLTNDSAFRAQSSISGQGGDDTIRGKSAVNNLNGGSGSDTIYGGGVITLLTGGSGKDYLHGADDTADVFRVFRSEAASSARQADEIHNFTGGTDKIYLPGLARVEVVRGQNVAGGSANDTIIKSGNDYFAVIVDATLSLDEDDFNVSSLFGETIAPPDVI